MKIKLIFFFLLVLKLNCFGQTYRNKVEMTEAAFQGQGWSYDDNSGLALHAHESGMMQAYLDIYKATKDKKYLDKFIIHAKRVQERRDDVIQNSGAFIENLSPCTNTTGISIVPDHPLSKKWSTDSDINTCENAWVGRVLHQGSITFPMAEFIYFMKTDPDFMLHSGDNLPIEVSGNFLDATNISTYLQFADWLEVKVNETVQDCECNWSCCDFAYHHDCNNIGNCSSSSCSGSSSSKDEINMQCAMGKTLIMMYLVESLPGGNPGYAATYISHVSNIGTTLHSDILQLNVNDPNAYTWCHSYSCSCIEDLTHASIVMEFADLCYSYNILNINNSGLLFNLGDMNRFANTFANHIYRAPLDFAKNTFGTDNNICNASDNASSSGYLFLSKYNPYIYEEISDYFCDQPIGDFEIEKSFADLALYEHLFNPVAVLRRGLPNLNYYTNTSTATSSGDFNGDGNNEFVGAYDFGGSTFIQEYSLSSGNLITSQSNNVLTINNPVTSMAGGDFDFTHSGDELAVCDPTIHKIFIYSISISGYNLISTISSNAISIATGDFDSDGDDDLIAADNQNLYLYQNTGSGLTLFSTVASAVQINEVTAGNLDINHQGDEFLTIGANGQMQMYSLQSSTITPTYNYSAQANLNFPSVCSGDFDGDGISEIMAFCSTEGSYKIYKLKNGLIVHNSRDEEYFPTNQLNGVMCSSRFESDMTKDALVAIRSFDGQISIFNMSGHCPGLNLSNQTIDDATSTDNRHNNSFDNNFPLDYHVNNTLVAGNNFNIVAPSIVTFTAGNEIVLKPGFTAAAGCDFRAYIDPGIACNSPNFRLANTNSSNSNSVSQQQTIAKKSSDLSIKPNPTEGKFTYSINESGMKENNYQVVVMDVLGKIILNEKRNSPSGELDLSQYYNGVYFLRIICDDGNSWEERLIVSH